jgi:hypothetical protein
MRKFLVIGIIVIVSVCGIKGSAFCITPDEEITYPPKQPSTSLKDVSNAFDSLTASVKDLSHAVVGDIKKQGISKSVHSHIKFYGSISIFFFLWMVWLRNRKH